VMVIDADDQLLLVKNNYRGWEFPGGFVDKGESIKNAAIREVKEESGIDIHLTNFLGIEQEVAKMKSVIIFRGVPVGGGLATSKESKDVGFFSIDEAMSKIRVAVFRERIVRCLDKGEVPFIIER
jgi:8-oxo-dGTP diphosphatase